MAWREPSVAENRRRPHKGAARPLGRRGRWFESSRPDHFSSSGVPSGVGGTVGFRFQPVRFLVEAAPPFEVVLDVQGELRGRVRRDGKIDLVIDTSRRNGLAEVGQPLYGFTAEAGRKTFTVAPEEAVRIILPEATGDSRTGLVASQGATVPAANTSIGQAVELSEGKIEVNHALFFEGHETSLTVTAKRER